METSTRSRQTILLLGATGTAGRGAARALLAAGHDVVALVRRKDPQLPAAIEQRVVQITEAEALANDGFKGTRFDAIVSCLASRSGLPRDAWAVDYGAHATVLAEAQKRGRPHFIYLSAICVQKPKLAFQEAKLAFEADLMASGLRYSIVRPTAFFKSLSGQLARVRDGKPYLMFGDGTITACKPISDNDLGRFIASCVRDTSKYNQILPIGGPGSALTSKAQAQLIGDALGQDVRMRSVPVALLNGIVGLSSFLGRFSQTWADRAEFAKIGRYYATESMLVWDADAGRYDADATPEYGDETLEEHYVQLALGEISPDFGEHAVF